MTEMTKYEHGQFCWADLGTSDANAAKKFYGELFGWKAVDMPAGPDMTYTMLNKGDKDVAALFHQTQPGVPPCWNNYVSVTNVDDAAKKASELGGKIIKAAFDVMDAGRTAVLQDPTGAVVSVWQGNKHAGARLLAEPGAMCWNERMTNDVDRAATFYTKLFGWSARIVDVGGGQKYTLFDRKDGSKTTETAGMMQIQKAWGPVPPNWLVYLATTDVDASAKKANSLGGKVFAKPEDIPNIGRFAVIQDPQGAMFALFKSTRS
jgi:uncharacterized protein